MIRLLAAFCLWASVVATAGAEAPQRVLIWRPESAEPALLAAFAHLEGELELHAFEAVVMRAEGSLPDAELERSAQAAGALAAVALDGSGQRATAQVWIGARAPQASFFRTLSVELDAEGPSLLAVRIVDLLRVRLREPAEPSAERAAPAPAPPVRPGAPTEKRRRFAIEAGALVQLAASRFRPALGPHLALGYDFERPLGLRVVAQAPLLRARVTRSGNRADLVQQELLAELRVRLWAGRFFSCAALAAAGAHHLRVEGEARPPYRSAQQATWTAVFAAGLGGAVQLAPAVALSLRGRVLMLTPGPVIELADARLRHGRPLMQIASGLDVSF